MNPCPAPKEPVHAPRRTRHALALAAVLFILAPLSPTTATGEPVSETRLVRDGRFGSLPAGEVERTPSGEFEIGEQHGQRPGGSGGVNLFHSFSIFDLAAPDTARFTANAPTETVVLAVPDAPMRIDGRMAVDIPGSSLFILSPQGIMVGPETQFDVPGALHLSTADSLAFSDGPTTETFEVKPGGAVPTLAMAHPGAFGFLGDSSQRIVFDSSLICGTGVGFCGGAEVGGRLSIRAGGVDLTGGTAIIMNDQGIEVVAEDSITLSGFDTDGLGSTIQVNNRSVQQGGSIELSAGRIHLTDAATLFVENNSEEMTGGGNIRLAASQSILLDGTDENDDPLGPATLYKGFTEVGRPDVTSRLQKGSVDILTLNANYEGSAFGGNITLEAPKVLLRDGAEVTSYAFGRRAGDITLLASRRLELSGRGGGLESGGSRVQSRNAGIREEADDEPSQLLIQAGEVTLSDGGLLAVNTAGLADAGSIRIETSKFSLAGASQVTSSSTGTVDDFSNFPGEFVMGDAGDIFIAADQARLRGGSQISVFAQEGPPVPQGLGAGEPTPEGVVRGNIEIQANKLVLEGNSQIEASAGTGLGGSIQIGSTDSPTQAVILRDDSDILAQAQGDSQSPQTPARGGDIEIHSEAVFQCPDCVINADGPTAGTEGSVIINDPETAIESQVSPPPVAYLDASSLLLERCGAATAPDQSGRLAVARWPGIPLSPEGPLLALPSFGEGARPTWAQSPPAVPESAEDETFWVALRSASEALRGGHTARAGEDFARTERAAAEAGQVHAQGDALRGLAEALQVSGGYSDSVAPLEQALELAQASDDAARQAAAMGALGNAYAALGEFAQAESMLTQAVAIVRGGVQLDRASQKASGALEVALLNNLGNERSMAGDPRGALSAYQESAAAARADGHSLLAAQADANAARAALALGLDGEARRGLSQARAALERAHALTAEDAALRIHVAHTEAALAAHDPTARRQALLNAHADLIRASEAALEAGDLRTASYALGNLGALYAQEGGRQREALYLTRRAVRAAEQAQAADLLARWYAQEGRLAAEDNQTEAALDAYRRAVALLEETRPESAAAYGSADLAFRQAVEPVYLALVNLLLRSSETTSGPSSQQQLAEAREVVEQWKAAELRNYFRDACVAELEATARPVESVDPGAAVIYPIVLPDRLEILVSRATGIARYTVPIESAELDAQVHQFRRLLGKRATHEYRQPAQKLHEWLVEPYQPLLEREKIHTLVFVPGGALRTVPMAALHDGESFLLQRYAVAITPSLNLLAPKPIVPGETRVLIAGLSEPVQGYPALPGVPDELSTIEKLYGGKVLLNQSFELGPFEQSLRDIRPGVVHIASHAEFTGNPRTSFVLTYNDRLSIEQLADLMRAGRYGQEPVELLMLSACDTAVGDDRAALGLAGMAVRAGARSAMGSLWSVSDEATSELVVGFYQALDTPGTTKAQALQQAQQSLLMEGRFQHPYYWAPFLVINNWL